MSRCPQVHPFLLHFSIRRRPDVEQRLKRTRHCQPTSLCQPRQLGVVDRGSEYWCDFCTRAVTKYPPVDRCPSCTKPVRDPKGGAAVWCNECKSAIGKPQFENKWENVRIDGRTLAIERCEGGSKAEVFHVGNIVLPMRTGEDPASIIWPV